MIDRATTTSDDNLEEQHSRPEGNDQPAESLVQRVQRLEDAVAALQDTRLMEERILERVTERFAVKASTSAAHATPGTPSPDQTPVENLVTAERRTTPSSSADLFTRAEELRSSVPNPTVSNPAGSSWLIF